MLKKPTVQFLQPPHGASIVAIFESGGNFDDFGRSTKPTPGAPGRFRVKMRCCRLIVGFGASAIFESGGNFDDFGQSTIRCSLSLSLSLSFSFTLM